ncbi:MFS transporter [Streptomyces sp. NBRC 109706]|uniref:MFS transporter n=1 Tax=Streptomyces sp. NBRC 109706 TaxID=1550035 RepID=UPI000781B6E8|nr:MFS transporter [Streptomyces sp. NBRC 109706]
MSDRMRRRVDAYRLYLFGMVLPVSFLGSFAGTTAIVYYVQSGRLNPLELVLLGTSVELAYFLTQLPSGVLADTVSRRLCVSTGWILLGTGFAQQGLSPSFANLFIAQLFIGVGAALHTGAQDAWIADELDAGKLTPVYVLASQLTLLGTLCGALLSGVVADRWPRVPLLAGGVGIILIGVLLIFVMPRTTVPHGGDGADGGPSGVVGRSWRLFLGQLREARIATLAVPGFMLLVGCSSSPVPGARASTGSGARS